MKAFLRLAAVLAVVAVLFLGGWMWSRRPGTVLYTGGPILTMDADDRVAEALLTKGSRIAAVGSEEEVRAALGGSSAREVDLGGRTLLPGFIDAHGHFPGAGLTAVMADLNAPPIGDVRSIADIVGKLRKLADEKSAGEWLVGIGYDDTLISEHRHPTRYDLDDVSSEHPVAINHVSGHVAVFSSLALAELGIDADTPDPVGGRIVRDGDGVATGLLEEEAATQALGPHLQPSALDALKMVRRANEIYLAAGVTTAQSGYTAPEFYDPLIAIARFGLINLRLVVWPDEAAAIQILDGSLERASGERVRSGAVKLVADGSIQAYTGYLSEPYHVPPGDDPSYRGYPRIERDDLIEKVVRLHSAGFQLAVHGNGDASIDDILDAFEAAQRSRPRKDTRHIIIHAQMTREDQLERMRRLSVIPSFFVLHTYYWGDRHRDIFMGPERAARMSPARSALRHGVRFTLHTDTPVVPIEPLRLVWAAVNRRSTSGATIGEGERITPLQALRAVTIDAAWQHFEEAEKGSLEVGKLADLVVLSRSPLDAPRSIDSIEVVETVIGGRSVYRRPY